MNPTTRQPLEWKFSQVFGERSSDDEIQDADRISTVEFDKSGDYVAVGDRGGRIVIFETKDGKNTADQHYSRNQLEQLDYVSLNHPEYRYKTEFQSHEPEFDYLKSLEIEEKVNKLKWCTSLSGSLFILSTNDKTIKLWKVWVIRTSQDVGIYVDKLLHCYALHHGVVNENSFGLWSQVKDRKVKKAREIDSPHQLLSLENTLLSERSFMNEQGIPYFANGNRVESGANSIFPSQEPHSKIANYEDAAYARCRREYAHAHDFNINSISNNSDGETFISADDLRINLWNLEVSNQSFNIIDMKPSNMEELTVRGGNCSNAIDVKSFASSFDKITCLYSDILSYKVITSAEFHPIHCNLLAYSSSRGFIRLVDMRQSALCDYSARIFQDEECHGSRSFLTEIVASITDIKFPVDGRHILSRDYMNLKLWDMHMDSSPVATFKIHEHLRPKLCDLYNNDSIFDKFECCLSGDGLHFATGSYSNLLRIFFHGGGSDEGATIEASKDPNSIKNRKPLPRARRSSLSNLTRGFYKQGQESTSVVGEYSLNSSSKLQHLAWHPCTYLIACASGNSLFFYHA
ncbi:Serine/threonine phosphatase 2A 55 kDa regulatory subunit B beta-like protein [Gossypium australe]|uniref:Serine/threonine-protein phosphatase 2A 55 kDa regulatory subunit B n=1 Tax=Gossypium australe TaxID=47621 RepID=A0A5B6UTD2_9ROSI|nr:Serine/threonine phosphatase 2A 55 kDa regulatory subunit B beta-like protein [Gossypium australe]